MKVGRKNLTWTKKSDTYIWSDGIELKNDDRSKCWLVIGRKNLTPKKRRLKSPQNRVN